MLVFRFQMRQNYGGEQRRRETETKTIAFEYIHSDFEFSNWLTCTKASLNMKLEFS